ncbi:MAG TPA: methyltransferase domain-containing protein [Acidobacteriota bacterium]|nr:methyltransferase domain-containing protein [Acidobacteriota bacterium]
MPDIERYYGPGREDARLRTGSGRLELERMRGLMDRFLPPAPAVVFDVGGGTGIHAFWLAGKGYKVHLLDVVPVHIEEARKASATQRRAPLAEMVVGDARSLPWPDAGADAVLLLGPLYHLTALEDRRSALKEARRVLEPGGTVLAAGISRFASALDGIREGYLKDPAFAAIVEGDLADGRHSNPTGRVEYFMDTFFHHPEELRSEVASAGFEAVNVLGVEGPGWLAHDFDAWWDDPALRERLLGLARRLEAEPALAGLSAHLLAVARKP